MKKHIVIGVLAHVDAGKTTLSEGILYSTGVAKKLGRVDSKDTMLDHDDMEKSRGITIYSAQAEFEIRDTEFTLLDTPGHVDFAAEMERTLQVLDYAILVISGSDGVQAHTRTLWRLLKQYNIPTFIFVNKMDQPDNDTNQIMLDIQKELSDGCVCFSRYDFGKCVLAEDYLENIAVSSGSEEILDMYMESEQIPTSDIVSLIKDRKIYPCYFGSALKLQGIDELLQGLDCYSFVKPYEEEFGARVYKITRDHNGNRLAHMKISSGKLSVRDTIGEEKVTQIRVYNGSQFDTISSVEAGRICSVAGLDSVVAGQGLGICETNNMDLIEPVLTYKLSFDKEVSTRKLYPELKVLEEEMPELHLSWVEKTESIQIMLMGQVQIEVLTGVIKNRFGVVPTFDTGSISYKETIKNSVIGVGHFEPLRHYAEAHIRIEPGELGSGIEVATDCSEDILDKNWQRLIVTHLMERTHLGVKLGAPITDVKFTVINGKAHNKHTEGGDFRQATYRAVRQGLMEAETVILEPFYNFVLEIPSNMVGRAMTDIENRFGTMEPPELLNDKAIIKGYGPVSTLRDYQIHVNAYTSGTGTITVSFRGYEPCHNQEEVLANSNYDPESDLRNPTSSVFCAHGSGFVVPWDQVKAYMHVSDDTEDDFEQQIYEVKSRENFDYSIDLEEIDAIFSKTFKANQKDGKQGFKKKKLIHQTYGSVKRTSQPLPANRKKLLLVDGYNVIFAWDTLNDLAKDNIDAAKDKLIAVLSNYQGIVDHEILVVFDGYKVKGNRGSDSIREDIRVVHTKEGETADQYIEQFTHSKQKEYQITVATSDGLIQTITSGAGCSIVSSRELYKKIEDAAQELREMYSTLPK